MKKMFYIPLYQLMTIVFVATLVAIILPLLIAKTALSAPAGAELRQPAGIIYVDRDATGTNNGSSWANAFTSLQSALDVAGTGAEIWVAEGTYIPTKPSDGGDPRSATFRFDRNQGIAIYGGFAGTETTRSQRDWVAHPTILSGDLAGNDGPNFANNGENSYHVLNISYTEGPVIIDGFTIRGGNANKGEDCSNLGGAHRCHSNGGGINNVNMASPTLANLIIQDNYALREGGGMYNFCDSNPSLKNITFSGNQAGVAGGGLTDVGHPTDPNCPPSQLTLTDVVFEGNSAQFGGGMVSNRSKPTLTNVTFSSNTASSVGGAMYNTDDSLATLNNVTFNGNMANIYGGAIYNTDDSDPTLNNVIFSGNRASSGGGIFNEGSNPILTNALFSGNRATAAEGGAMRNLDSDITLKNATFSGNTAIVGGGIYNSGDSHLEIHNSILWGNSGGNTDQEAQLFMAPDVNNQATVSYSLIQGGVYAGTGNVSTDPLFLDVDGPDNIVGTTDDDLRLGLNSPAIDKGNAAACPTADLRGVARPQGAGCDMGAYEANYSLQVSLISDPFPVLTTTTRITYTISLRVAGDIPLTGVQLTTQIPSQTTFVSASDGGTHSNGQITWSGLSLPAGSTLSRTFVVSVTSTLNEGDLLVNTLAATSTQGLNLPPTQIPTIVNPKLVYLPLILK